MESYWELPISTHMSKIVSIVEATIIAALILMLPAVPLMAQEVPGCGSIQNAFGPFDYRDPEARGQPLHLVEIAHYTPAIASLTHGESGQVIDELDYTLRAFPNHHRALQSLSRYALGGGKFRSSIIPNADCFFLRAVLFRPDDEAVRVLYGNYLFKRGNLKDAKEQFESALSLAPDSPEISYNAGLFYVEINDLETASKLANIAYAAGYPLPGLKKKLEAALAKKSKLSSSSP